MQTFTPIRGMIICENDTGDYVLKSDYDEIKHRLDTYERLDNQSHTRITEGKVISGGVGGIPSGPKPKIDIVAQKPRTRIEGNTLYFNTPFNPLDHEQTK